MIKSKKNYINFIEQCLKEWSHIKKPTKKLKKYHYFIKITNAHCLNLTLLFVDNKKKEHRLYIKDKLIKLSKEEIRLLDKICKETRSKIEKIKKQQKQEK